MPEGLNLLTDFSIIMVTAGVVIVLFRRLHLPVVLGYLVAGLIVGPYTPPFPLVRDAETIRQLADFGIILLLFSLGLGLPYFLGLPGLVIAAVVYLLWSSLREVHRRLEGLYRQGLLGEKPEEPPPPHPPGQ